MSCAQALGHRKVSRLEEQIPRANRVVFPNTSKLLCGMTAEVFSQETRQSKE